MDTVSVCASHSPREVLDVGADGVLRLGVDELASFRSAAAAHIGECSRGPIIAIPVSTEAIR